MAGDPLFEVGRYNTLPVLGFSSRGARLGTEDDYLILPKRQIPEGTEAGDTLEVFVYHERGDRPAATTLIPAAVVGEFAYLQVVDVTEHGAFLDWGLPKDLFAPFGRQHRRMRVGERVVVAVSLHARTGRVIASSTLSGHFDDDVSGLTEGQEVDLLVYGFNEIGAQVVVNGRHAGLVFQDRIHQPLKLGDALKGFIEQIRPDHRLDIALQQTGRAGTDAVQTVILEALDEAGGFLALHDKSPPAYIKAMLGVSKKAFKKAVGALYKARIIEIGADGIRRVSPPS